MNYIKEYTRDGYEALAVFVPLSRLNDLAERYEELAPHIEAGSLKAEANASFTLPSVWQGKAQSLYVKVLDDSADLQSVYEAFGTVAMSYSGAKKDSVLVDLGLIDVLSQDWLTAAMKGLLAGGYAFSEFQGEKKAAEPQRTNLFLPSDVTYWGAVMDLVDSIRLARELVDRPANLLKPANLAAAAVEALSGTAVEVQVLEREDAERLGMNLYLSVAKGSDAPPKLIVMRYNGNPQSNERVGLIGKGLTYDSGGYSIKPTDSMLTMKSDMGGAAAVIGAMKAIAAAQPKVNVVAVVASCENMISSRAYLPGDIIKSMNGKTVEILNTDAEGRLTLADAMTYAIRHEGATKVVDICTLTGACLVALGEEFAGVITWDKDLWHSVESVSERTLEPCWRLPLTQAFKKKNQGSMADLKNTGGRWGGTITAGSFVGEFAEDKPWIHFDVAGTAYIETAKPYMRSGATGFGVHLLAELVKELG